MNAAAQFARATQPWSVEIENLVEQLLRIEGKPWDTIRLDVWEDDSQYLVKADIPGVREDDILIHLTHGMLIIWVAGREECHQDAMRTLLQERSYASQMRVVCLPGALAKGTTATLALGVLRLTLPKRAEMHLRD